MEISVSLKRFWLHWRHPSSVQLRLGACAAGQVSVFLWVYFLSLHLQLSYFICQVTPSYKGTLLHKVTADAKSTGYKNVQVQSVGKGFNSVSVPLEHLGAGDNWLSCLPYKVRKSDMDINHIIKYLILIAAQTPEEWESQNLFLNNIWTSCLDKLSWQLWGDKQEFSSFEICF